MYNVCLYVCMLYTGVLLSSQSFKMARMLNLTFMKHLRIRFSIFYCFCWFCFKRHLFGRRNFRNPIRSFAYNPWEKISDHWKQCPYKLKCIVFFTQIKYVFQIFEFNFVKYDEFCQIILNENRKYNYSEELTWENTLDHKGKKFPIITLLRKKYSISNKSNAFKWYMQFFFYSAHAFKFEEDSIKGQIVVIEVTS